MKRNSSSKASRRRARARASMLSGEVDVLVGVVDPAQVMGLPHLVRQHVRQDVGAGVQPLADGPGEHQLADPGGQGIDGHDAAGDLPPSRRLHHRGGHLPAQEIPLRPAVKDVGLSLVGIVFQPGLVEIFRNPVRSS